jgi:hypothetical protein
MISRTSHEAHTQTMLTQRQVWAALRGADQDLRRMVAGGSPSAKHLRAKFDALHRRLYCDPPAGPSETIQRLKAMRDECRAELAVIRPALESALEVAQQCTGDWVSGAAREDPRRPPLESYFVIPTTWPAASRSTSAVE